MDMMLVESGIGIVILQGDIGERILELHDTAVPLIKKDNTLTAGPVETGTERLPDGGRDIVADRLGNGNQTVRLFP